MQFGGKENAQKPDHKGSFKNSYGAFGTFVGKDPGTGYPGWPGASSLGIHAQINVSDSAGILIVSQARKGAYSKLYKPLRNDTDGQKNKLNNSVIFAGVLNGHQHHPVMYQYRAICP